MSHATRSAGGRGPWLADDDLATLGGSYTGPAAGDASPAGTLTVDGLALAGDVVNVWEQATLVGQGPAIFAALAKNQ